MRALRLHEIGSPLRLDDVPVPVPGRGEVRIAVQACGVCRTDLHVVDGDLPNPALPLIPGHQIVGVIDALGDGVSGVTIGDRVGVPWLGGTCGHCEYCASGSENLCDDAIFTGYQKDGGFAEFAVARADFCFPLPSDASATQVAPLLCAGLIGYRSLRIAGDGKRLGFYGFGAAAHILAQVARDQQREVFAFTRPGDVTSQEHALRLGAKWAGGSDEAPPELLDAAIIFAPVGSLVPAALRAVKKGGCVVCAGIHMSDIPSFPYEILWGERTIRSVANLTRRDGEEFLALVPQVPIVTETTVYPLEETNEALRALRDGEIEGAVVIDVTVHASP